MTPAQVKKMVELRSGEEPVSIENLAVRFGVCERTVYYYLRAWREATAGLAVSLISEVERRTGRDSGLDV